MRTLCAITDVAVPLPGERQQQSHRRRVRPGADFRLRGLRAGARTGRLEHAPHGDTWSRATRRANRCFGRRGGRQGREHRRPSDHRRYIPQLLELVRTGVIVPSTVPSRSATCPGSSTPTTVDQRQTGWTKVALDTRPDTLSAYCDAERDLVSDSVTAQEVLGHLVDEEALVAVAVAVAETHGASTDLARPARDRARGRLPRR
jgi:hypothetical protein